MIEPYVGLQRFDVNLNDRQLQMKALALAKGVLKQEGVATTIGMFVFATDRLLTELMHMETPVFETNIASIRTLLSELQTRVMSHEDCARDINSQSDDEPTPKEQVH